MTDGTQPIARSPAARYAVALWLLLGLFCLRVLGQFMVAFFAVAFLPPMEEWYSGLIPYGPLLHAQVLIIILLSYVSLSFTRGVGYFVRPNRRLGRGLVIFGALYLTAMIIRYIGRMSLLPDERWTGGSIPIFFHWVLASYVLVVGQYHWRRT